MVSHSQRMKSRPAAERFWEKVHKTETCWIWTANKNGKKAYGLFRPGGTAGKQLAHRVSYEMKYGPIPEGAFCCHTCDTPLCVNPDHIFLGDNMDNIRDSCAKGRKSQKIPRSEHAAIIASAESNAAIARRYGVHRSSIRMIRVRAAH